MSGGSLPAFQRNASPPSSGFKQAVFTLLAGCLFDFLFDPEDGIPLL
jgi:hypothetical protein